MVSVSSLAAAARPRLRGWLHIAAAPVAAVAAVGLIRAASTPGPVLVFGACLVGLYAVSGLYHAPRWPARARYWLSRCDVAMIQLFIAGSFTPVAFHALSGAWRTWSLVIAWTVAVVGAGVAASPLRAPRWLSTLGYVGMGWLGVVPAVKIIGTIGWEGTGLIALGGLLYTLGAVVYATRWPDPAPRWFGFHEVFHLLVIAGSTAHYLAIWRYVLPLTP
jgi:hemolysin III